MFLQVFDIAQGAYMNGLQCLMDTQLVSEIWKCNDPGR
jgi:hypothetical protein